MKLRALRHLWLLACWLAAPSAWAACSFDGGYMTSQFSISLNQSLAAARDTPAGTELFSSTWRPATGVNIRCNSNGKVAGVLEGDFGVAQTGVPGHRNGSVFATTVPGVGIQVFWCNQQNCNPDYNNVTPVPALNWSTSATTYRLRNSWWVRLVKTGQVTSGSHAFRGTARVRYDGLEVARLSVQGVIEVAARGCRLDPASSAQVVRLPPVSVDAFQNIGELPNEWLGRPFDFRLDCDPGIRLSLRIDPLYPSNIPDVLANRPAPGMATNVGVRLYRELAGRPQVMPTLTPVLMSMSTSGGALRLPMVVRYYQVGTKVSPGAFSTSAIFTLYYE